MMRDPSDVEMSLTSLLLYANRSSSYMVWRFNRGIAVVVSSNGTASRRK